MFPYSVFPFQLQLPKPSPSLRASVTLLPIFPAVSSQKSLLPPGVKTCSYPHGTGPGISEGPPGTVTADSVTAILCIGIFLPGTGAMGYLTMVAC